MNIIRLSRDWLRNLFVVQNIFYLPVTLEQKGHWCPPEHFPRLHGLPGAHILSKILSAQHVSGFLFWESGFPASSAGKESACNTGDPDSIPGSGRSGEGIGYPLQYSGLENPMDSSPRGHKESDTPERLSLLGIRTWEMFPRSMLSRDTLSPSEEGPDTFRASLGQM